MHAVQRRSRRIALGVSATLAPLMLVGLSAPVTAQAGPVAPK